MIEPHSAQLGASAWAANVTWPLPIPRLPRVVRGLPLVPLPFPLPLAWPLPLSGVAPERGVAGPSLAGGVDFADSSGAATAVTPLGGEAGCAASEGPLPEVPALLAPEAPPDASADP